MFYRQAQRLSERPLLHHHVGAGWRPKTWAETRQMVLAEASALIRAGVQAGDHVVLIAENRVEWPVSDLAIQSVGAITVPIYATTPPAVARGIAADAGAVFAIAGDEKLAAKVPTTSVMRAVVLMDRDLQQWFAAEPTAAELEEIARRLEGLGPDDIASVIYTSGTTGEPKGVELAHRSFVEMARVELEAFPLGETDVALSWLPLSHVFERTTFFICMSMGGQVYMSRGVDHLAADIGEVHPTVMTGVPRVYEKMHAAVIERVRSSPAVRRSLFDWAIRVGRRFSHDQHAALQLQLQHRLADRLVLHALRERLVGGRLRMFISGGAALAPDVEEFFWAIGVPIYQGWGLTETCSGATSNTPNAHRFGSVGKPFRGVELKIADDGEILVKSPGNMLGYRNKPEATAEVLKDGWLYTGDIGVIDGEGFLAITDRKKALFKTTVGKYVAPQPLEVELMRDPLIERAVVVGDGRPYVTALVVPDWDAARKGGLDDAAVNQRVQKAVDAANEGHGSWERIQYFTLLREDFSEAKGELSLKLDVKRKVVQERYQEQIESMYDRKQKPA
ncbi:MAG TPA: long-chain fatty acid--CoA ligase [Chloroflexi bacterium]|jgi:long-chain acyl-CoA synthetase|nr:long-chain fatty acid--CoA ligase [Chloroflexota bacterium]